MGPHQKKKEAATLAGGRSAPKDSPSTRRLLVVQGGYNWRERATGSGCSAQGMQRREGAVRAGGWGDDAGTAGGGAAS